MSALNHQPHMEPGVVELLERSMLLDGLAGNLARAADGYGGVVLLGGEAGAGKTALLRAFCAAQSSARVLWGACERLFTPRALGPFLDIAESAGLELGSYAPHSRVPHEFVLALVTELRRRGPTVLVVEDVHWADEGTLDTLKLLARRIGELRALALVSFREDELAPTSPLQMVLGELAGAATVERRRVPPLSLDAVRTLAAPWGADAGRLFEKTGGNPFFVTEALAAGDAEIPSTVRDAVLARAAQLAPAPRRVLEAASVVPSRTELWLLEAIAGEDLVHLEACLGSGMLGRRDGAVAFRHELARLAIEEAIAPDRRVSLHRAVLRALSTPAGGAIDPARLSHHADAAGDAEAVLRHAPIAGERAAALCGHREAAEQFARALRHAATLPSDRQALLWERRSYECYLTQQIDEATEARRAALALHQERGDCVRAGDSRRWLSRLAWFAGDNATAVRESAWAIELLEREPPGRELAMAYSNEAQLCMLANDAEGAVAAGTRAIELASRLGETEILVHALNNVGAAEMMLELPGGVQKLERSLALAVEAGFEEHVARAYTNLAATCVSGQNHAAAERYLSAGIVFCLEHDLDPWRVYMTGWEARLRLAQGRWDEAEGLAGGVLQEANVPTPSRVIPLAVLGRIRARRGEPQTWAPLDQGLALARRTAELQRLAPVCAARAEARWLQGAGTAAVVRETGEAVALARARRDAWALGELVVWRWRAGVEDQTATDTLAAPYALELAGEWAAAAERWEAIGCPYEAAFARLGSDDEGALRDALAEFQRLGAVPAARAAAQRLRGHGVTSIARGPNRSTAGNPRQLTSRQVEILGLLGERLTNAEIAARLYITPKTVEHHVSAILGKLGVRTRRDAAAEAIRLGLAVAQTTVVASPQQ